VPLSVEEVDPADGRRAELTVVLVHGFALDRRSWHYQRRDLALCTEPRVRQVLYDHRGHGHSGRPNPRSCTIEQIRRATSSGVAVPRRLDTSSSSSSVGSVRVVIWSISTCSSTTPTSSDSKATYQLERPRPQPRPAVNTDEP